MRQLLPMWREREPSLQSHRPGLLSCGTFADHMGQCPAIGGDGLHGAYGTSGDPMGLACWRRR